MADTNYSSGDDYIVVFLGYRFTYNACDFEQRVVAGGVVGVRHGAAPRIRFGHACRD